ncbi:hypothetical protein AXF42_Ash008424 [Apostasia shenzhenica]|uniref:Uncharacterized protein n=1 Tax=Apostasia shenzhenica TaxID=1088818 RepID=A0A2I0AXU7_9ASPA|nr:hypothetical protein AXF42_Ash008424 [Apostasia shenzhenica]
MVRGRGKGKKLTAATSKENHGSGAEELLSTCKMKGRPQKPLKDDMEEDETELIEEGLDGVKPTISSKEDKSPVLENGMKRKRHLQEEEISDSALEDNGMIFRSKGFETTKINSFRQTGRKRKGKPHRAAEAEAPIALCYALNY